MSALYIVWSLAIFFTWLSVTQFITSIINAAYLRTIETKINFRYRLVFAIAMALCWAYIAVF